MTASTIHTPPPPCSPLISAMETITEVVHSSKQIKIQVFSATYAVADGEGFKLRKWNVGGYDWEVQVHPNFKDIRCRSGRCYVAFHLYLRSEVPTGSNVKAKFSHRLVDPSGKLSPRLERSVPVNFNRSGECCSLSIVMAGSDLLTSGYLQDDSFTVECTITVPREVTGKPATRRPADYMPPSSSLPNHLGDLLQKGTGSDVTFVVSGESFAAHKALLASRSPVFAAEFFGHMKETRSPRVEIKDMAPAVFGAMLRFIYTDSAPELDRPEDGAAVAQHLLAAADRYGIDRLKLIWEDKLYGGVGVDTAATTLALAEQHGCSQLKARCVELIAANLDAVMATEGYRHLMASCPAVMNDLLKAVHGRKN